MEKISKFVHRLEKNIACHEWKDCALDPETASTCRATADECILMAERTFMQYAIEGGENFDLYTEDVPIFDRWIGAYSEWMDRYEALKKNP